MTPTVVQKPGDDQRQVVRTKKVENSEIPKDRAFLGEKNQTVDRQTVSREGGVGKSGAPHSRSGAQAKSSTDKSGLSRFGVALFPRPQEERSLAGGDGRTKEYVIGLKEGEETALSTREFVFFSYFERIRGRLDQAWGPILRDHLIRHYRQGRRLASEVDHKTEVVVALDVQGKVIGVQVVGESGVETLDVAAVQAFNRAGPFPHPPRGLIGHDGVVRIRWEFILKT